MKTTAIIGAGPAGSLLAYKLASNGKKVYLFDHKAPWEKPCGGMLHSDVINENSELKGYPYPISLCKSIVYISPSGNRKTVSMRRPIPVISRLELGEYLLDMARNAGVEFIKKKVRYISHKDLEWDIKTKYSRHKADLIIGADGVNSIVRKAVIGKFPKEHLALTCGYLLNGMPENLYIMKFLDIEGYLWIFSHPDRTSAGIGVNLGTLSGKELFDKLNNFLDENYPRWAIVKKYSALIPAPTQESFFDNPCCGENWILVGDAAGHVDSVLGEGIRYAFKSANAAAKAVLTKDISAYNTLWSVGYGGILRQKARLKKKLTTLAQCFNRKIFGEMMYQFLDQ